MEREPGEGHRGYRYFDDPERFEREKGTRIMPADLKPTNIYTLRQMMPPDSRAFAVEMAVCHISTVAEEEYYSVAFACFRPGRDPDEPENRETAFNMDGYMVIFNTGEDSDPDLPDEIEIGYIVGSTDPIDVEFAQHAQQATPMLV